MRRPAISLEHDLPVRTQPLTDEKTSQVWGGCAGEGQHCLYDSDCCPGPQWTGSGKSYLRCIRNSAHRRVCSYL